jgi:hypothetical protein
MAGSSRLPGVHQSLREAAQSCVTVVVTEVPLAPIPAPRYSISRVAALRKATLIRWPVWVVIVSVYPALSRTDLTVSVAATPLDDNRSHTALPRAAWS